MHLSREKYGLEIKNIVRNSLHEVHTCSMLIKKHNNDEIGKLKKISIQNVISHEKLN